MRIFLFSVLISVMAFSTQAQHVPKVKITILSTMLSDLRGIGDWGFSALVEMDSTRILFDVGGRPNTVRDNAADLRISLAGIQQVVLSHNHLDHTAGLLPLREKFSDGKTASVSYIGQGFFLRDTIPVGMMKEPDSIAYVRSGGRFVVIDHFTMIAPGIYLTGPVPRKYPEKNFLRRTIKTAGGVKEDDVAEDMSMVIQTAKGLVLLTGCGHAGIVNTMEFVSQQFPGQKIVSVVGGIHLLDAQEDQVVWTANKMKEAGVQYFIGAHCTGINAVYRIREVSGLSKTACLVGAVGTSFDLDRGISTGWLR